MGVLVEGKIGAIFPYIILFVRSGVLAKYDSLKIILCNHVARLLVHSLFAESAHSSSTIAAGIVENQGGQNLVSLR